METFSLYIIYAKFSANRLKKLLSNTPHLSINFTALEQGACYEETNPRLLGKEKWAAWMKGEDGKPNNSPAACKKFCEGFKYYGVQARNQCFCGDKLHGALKKMPESQCKDVCPGDASQKCGGGGKMNVYQAQSPDDEAPTDAAPTAG